MLHVLSAASGLTVESRLAARSSLRPLFSTEPEQKLISQSLSHFKNPLIQNPFIKPEFRGQLVTGLTGFHDIP